jgi:hypothetical protein
MSSSISSDDEDVLSDIDEVIGEGNWPSLYPLRHNQNVIATAPTDGHQVRGLLVNMTGRQSASSFVAKNFEIYESSTRRFVICDADEYKVEPVADAGSAHDASAVTASSSNATNGETTTADVPQSSSAHDASAATASPSSATNGESTTADVPQSSSAHDASAATASSSSATNGETTTADVRQSSSTYEAPAAIASPSNATSRETAQQSSFVVFVNGDESEADEHSFHADSHAFKVGDKCSFVQALGRTAARATVAGRIVGKRSRCVQKYVLLQEDGSQCVVPCVFVMEPTHQYEFPTDDNEDGFSALNDDSEHREESGLSNASAVQALELSGAIQCFDVAKMDAAQIWYTILLKRNLCGGMLTRTILIAASNDSACLPLWNMPTTLEKTKVSLVTQGMDFIAHFQSHQKIAWLRVKLFTIVASNRGTYSRMRVTFNGHTQLSLATAGSPELTDDLRCRIAAIALDANCVKLLGLIFGSRDVLEKTDNRSLNNSALWGDIAHNFVNNSMWVPHHTAADSVVACRSVDTTVSPPSPGLDPTTIQDVFLECRSEWSRLRSAVTSPTGCNSTGTQMLKEVWENYINGGRLKFTHKVVTMYIFANWTAAGGNLPQLCNRTLAEHQKLQVGVRGGNPQFQTPQKQTPSTSSSTASTKTLRNSNALADIASALQKFTGGSSQSPIVLDEAPEKRRSPSIGAKRLLIPEDPDLELTIFMTKHKILKWWPEIYERLGITTIDELRFIGKEECSKSLNDLPALPRLKMATLAESSADHTAPASFSH